MSGYITLTAEKETDLASGCLYIFFKGNRCRSTHRHEFYEIFLTLEGTVIHWVNGQVRYLPEGSLVFIRPDDAHRFLNDETKFPDITYINLTFSKETAALLFEYLADGFPSEHLINSPEPPTVLLTSSEKNKLFADIDELNLVNWQDKNKLKLRLRVLLANIFTKYFSDVSGLRSEEIPSWLVRLNEKMTLPDNFTAGAERMIHLSGKSREHLSRTLKKYYGLPLSEYINDRRLNYASNLLLNSNTNILDICFSCGFENVSYFYRIFKKKYSMTPSGFRNKYGNAKN